MNNFNWYKAIGFGVIIWLIMFAGVSAFVGFGFTMTSIGWSLAVAALVGILSYLFAISSNAENSGQAIAYGAIWVAIGMILDYLISRQFNSGIFSSWTYWLGAVLILFAPWLEYEIQGVGAHPKEI